MKKIFLSLIFFKILSNSLFANNNFKGGNFLIDIGIGYEKTYESIQNIIYSQENFYEGYKEELNSISNDFPLILSFSYRFYLRDKLVLEPRFYVKYSQGRYSSQIQTIDIDAIKEYFIDNHELKIITKKNSSNAKYNKTDLGFALATQYDFYRYSPKAIFGLELGLGYEYSIINNKFDNKDFEKNFKVGNTGSISFDYGLYFIYGNTHRISINSQIKNYSKQSSKMNYYEHGDSNTVSKLGESYYSFTPGNYTTTLSYSYLF